MLSAEYVAGFIDGEGTITIRRKPERSKSAYIGHQIYVTATNTYKPVLDMLAEQYGGGVFSVGKGKYGRRRAYRWAVSGENAQAVLRSIRPYLVEKEPLAWLALEFMEQRTLTTSRPGLSNEEKAVREGYWLAMKMAQKNGTGVA